jgi:hypothetical protein
MNAILCSRVDFVFRSEIETFENGVFILKPDGEWKTFVPVKKPEYRSETRQADPGPARVETLSVQTRRDPAHVLPAYSNFPVILRLHTEDSQFYTGSLRFPALTEINSDGTYDTFTCTCTSIP